MVPRIPKLPGLPLRPGPEVISPTAHYTGHVWARNGLSHPDLATLEGRVLFDAIAPLFFVSGTLGGPTIEGLLVARHHIIDALLAEAIDGGRVTQVVELACGMSPRGWRFAERYGHRITYVEADLPAMAARKRRALERMGSLGDHHRVAEVDALRDDGPRSLAALTKTLDRGRGLAILTEGLLNYFPTDEVRGMWRRFAHELERFDEGLYLADLIVGGSLFGPIDRGFQLALAAFVRGGVGPHFGGEAQATTALRAAGFAHVGMHRGDRHPAAGEAARDPAARRIHVVEAATRGGRSGNIRGARP